MTPFGEGVDGAIDALINPLLTEDALPHHILKEHLRIVVQALDLKIADRNFLINSPTVSHTHTAFVTLMQQGLRLLVLERYHKARKLAIYPEMAGWLTLIKTSECIRTALNARGIRHFEQY